MPSKRPKAATTTATESTSRKRGSVANATQPVRTVDRSGLKVLKALNVPFLKLNVGDEIAVEIMGARRQMMDSNFGGKKDKPKEPATVLRSTDLDTGEEIDLIAPTVLVSTLTRAYGEGLESDDIDAAATDAWIGKRVLIECSRREGKRYMDCKVSELG